MCHAPGKILRVGRDGRSHNRNLAKDIKHFKEFDKIEAIVCLLNKYELRTIGVDEAKYQALCAEAGIMFISYPIIEMSAPPDNPQGFDQKVVQKIVQLMSEGKRVICHCRGGIGRAGTLAACLLLKTRVSSSTATAISFLRAVRDPRTVESRRQETFIEDFEKHINQGGKLTTKT
eukprot:TRINITY_DN11614_c0_g1_i3.p1 TRINITY_DN11614_c0_g1~~TRINITY_DN11614_c0_g1_i3.p1  ORF type:complete len:175 (+),score=18.54 TRINITY_DN11614_c0_g1_i3:352-876(+)